MDLNEFMDDLTNEVRNQDYIKVIYGKSKDELGVLDDSQKDVIEVIEKIKELEEEAANHKTTTNTKTFNALYKSLRSLVDGENLTDEIAKEFISRSRTIRSVPRDYFINKRD